MLDDPARVAVLGAANHERAARRFDVAAMTTAYGAVYDDVLGDEADVMAGFPPALVFA